MHAKYSKAKANIVRIPRNSGGARPLLLSWYIGYFGNVEQVTTLSGLTLEGFWNIHFDFYGRSFEVNLS